MLFILRKLILSFQHSFFISMRVFKIFTKWCALNKTLWSFHFYSFSFFIEIEKKKQHSFHLINLLNAFYTIEIRFWDDCYLLSPHLCLQKLKVKDTIELIDLREVEKNSWKTSLITLFKNQNIISFFIICTKEWVWEFFKATR